MIPHHMTYLLNRTYAQDNKNPIGSAEISIYTIIYSNKKSDGEHQYKMMKTTYYFSMINTAFEKYFAKQRLYEHSLIAKPTQMEPLMLGITFKNINFNNKLLVMPFLILKSMKQASKLLV